MRGLLAGSGRWLAVVLAVALLDAGGALARSSAARTGDWESVSGAQASLQVTRTKAGKTVLRDLVIVFSYSRRYPKCARGSQPYAFKAPIPVSSSGGVALTIKKRPGGYLSITTLTGRLVRSKVRLTFRYDEHSPSILNGPTHCSTGDIPAVLRPGHRMTVRDGVWSGHAADGEPVRFVVADGGREIAPGECAFGFVFGSWSFTNNLCNPLDACADFYGPAMFVTSRGTFAGQSGSNKAADLLAVAGRFTSLGEANGSWIDEPLGCQASWAASG